MRPLLQTPHSALTLSLCFPPPVGRASLVGICPWLWFPRACPGTYPPTPPQNKPGLERMGERRTAGPQGLCVLLCFSSGWFSRQVFSGPVSRCPCCLSSSLAPGLPLKPRAWSYPQVALSTHSPCMVSVHRAGNPGGAHHGEQVGKGAGIWLERAAGLILPLKSCPDGKVL